jgi:surface protein
MKNSFSGCSNLKVINFDKINSSNLENMENTFENCTELKSLNLSYFNTTNLKTANSLFSGCSKLEDLNIASFKNIDDNLFKGINSKPKISANEIISYNITKKFFELFQIKITIIIEIDIEIKDECKIGENEKCKTCSSTIPTNC